MKEYKPADLRTKSVEDLLKMVAEERAAMYQARKAMVFRQSSDTAGQKTRKHNVARILTIIKEKETASA